MLQNPMLNPDYNRFSNNTDTNNLSLQKHRLRANSWQLQKFSRDDLPGA